MYDGAKIIVGLIIFVALVTLPFWYNGGKAAQPPEPILTTKALAAKTCIEPTKFMKSSHMELLNEWRDKVVREGYRIYTATDDKKVLISLQNTCMDCHANKSQFCDQCHNYADVKPYCWDCHVAPKELSYGR